MPLIGLWLAFKIIGEWHDAPINKDKEKKDEDKVNRVRANNFLIGNAVSLIFGILGGVFFRLILNHNFLQNLIQKSY